MIICFLLRKLGLVSKVFKVSVLITGKKTTQLQKLRKDYIRRMCDIEKKALSAQKPRIKNIYDHLIVEERQKIIYCFIPKVTKQIHPTKS